MARLKGPLFSMEASGTVANSLVFAKWKGRDYVRRHAIPANPNSGLQRGIRAVFKFLTETYSALSAADKAEWVAEAAAENITALNAQIRDGVDRARRNLAPRADLTTADPAQIDAPLNCAAAAQPKTLVLTWDDPAANQPDYAWMIYHSLTAGFTPDISNLLALTTDPVETYTHGGLTTGVAQYYRIRGISESGFLGTLAAQFTGTPT